MALIVVDASVTTKALFPRDIQEADLDKALELWLRVRGGRVSAYQPAHWLAEVAAVLARLSPATVQSDVLDLHTMDLPVLDTPAVYATACRLAVDLPHHLFDTLYIAVALHLDGAVLVTADERYFRKARRWGRIVRLAEYDA
jgi:predicted nucleic acid-binding protein